MASCLCLHLPSPTSSYCREGGVEGGVLSLPDLVLCPGTCLKLILSPGSFHGALQRFSALGASPEVADTEAWALPPSALPLGSALQLPCLPTPHPGSPFEHSLRQPHGGCLLWGPRKHPDNLSPNMLKGRLIQCGRAPCLGHCGRELTVMCPLEVVGGSSSQSASAFTGVRRQALVAPGKQHITLPGLRCGLVGAAGTPYGTLAHVRTPWGKSFSYWRAPCKNTVFHPLGR